MPMTVNPIRKRIVKASLIEGSSARQALRLAKYAESSISHSTHNRVVKESMQEKAVL